MLHVCSRPTLPVVVHTHHISYVGVQASIFVHSPDGLLMSLWSALLGKRELYRGFL